ncbi:MAG: flagellar filament outer layer protein [bacterium]|nr:MAG: flagellar filament outer layer protein [bacterium]
MKRIIILGIILTLGMVGIVFSANDDGKKSKDTTGERNTTLIDFNTFEKEYENPYPKEGAKGTTKPDPSASKSKNQKGPSDNWSDDLNKYFVTQEDMALDNWKVEFNSSSNTYANRKYSLTKRATIVRGSRKGESVLGARIHFPSHRFNSHAVISPMYEIMEYNDKGDKINVGRGVIDNVYQIKQISVEVSGRNYDNRLMLRLMNQNREIKDFFMGYLNFVGWRKLIWKNASYIGNVDQRQPFKPRLYPTETPYYKFYGFVISRLEDGARGDFVVYFKKVDFIYDRSNVFDDQLSVDDEKEWGIRRHEFVKRINYLKKKNANLKILRIIERKRMGLNAEPKPTGANIKPDKP